MVVHTECNLAQIVVDILNGKTIIFPTETSYGLGCDATNQAAVDKIFKIKGRPSDKPLLVVVPNIEMAKKYLVWNEALEKIAEKYWPPFVKASEGKPGAVTVVGEYQLSPLLSKGEGRERSRTFSLDRVAGHLRTLPFRKELRQNQTKAEKILWSHLRAGRFSGLKFKRQHDIGPFVVDFFHPKTKTIIEIDGDIHFISDENVQKDKQREDWLKKDGYKILRYNNVDIFNNLENILGDIDRAIESARPLPTPSPLQMRGELATGVVAKDNTVAVRVTAHPLLKSITEKLGRPLVATSANISDAGDMYNSASVIEMFKDVATPPDIILNQGILPQNQPSTIVSVVGNKLKVLRQGQIIVKI